ncbi:MAG: zinc ribbon domain-containing protein [bacterium]
MLKTHKIKLNNITKSKKDLIFNYIKEYNDLSNYFCDLLWDNKQELLILEKQKRNYVRNNYITEEIKQKYHSHFIQEALVRVVSLLKNENITTKPIFNTNSITITKFLGDIKKYDESKLTQFWFHITIKHPGFKKRIKLPLPNKFNITDHKKTYQLVKYNDELYLILFKEHEQKSNKKDNTSYNVIGIDIGYRDLFALSNDKLYGENFKLKIDNYSEHINHKQIARNKLWQIAKKNKKKNPKKYTNIHKNNLGKKKQTRSIIKNRSIIKTEINTELNKIFKENGILILVGEYLKFKSKGKRSWRKDINRKLSYWCNGEIKRAMENKLKENGVFFSGVGASYTSQKCSSCGHIHKDNRKGKYFKCLSCGFAYDSDLNAAINIRERLRTDQPKLQTLVKNIVKYWKTNQSESELLEMLNYV